MAYRNSKGNSDLQYRTLIQKGQSEANDAFGHPVAEALIKLDQAIAYLQAAHAIRASAESAFELGSAFLSKAEFAECEEQRFSFAKEAILFLKNAASESGATFPLLLVAQANRICGENIADETEKRNYFDEAIAIFKTVNQRSIAEKVDVDMRCNIARSLMFTLVERGKMETTNRTDYYSEAVSLAEDLLELIPDEIGNRYNHQNMLVKAGIACIDNAQGRKWLERGAIANQKLIDELDTFDHSDPFFQDAGDWTPKNLEFDRVCVQTQLGFHDKALAFLAELLETNRFPLERVDSDEDLDPIRNLPEFIALRNSQ